MRSLPHRSLTFANVTIDQFKQLILPLKNSLFRFALSYLPNEADAKDVVQDVMLKSWEEIKDPGMIRNIEAWCITVTRNKALDKLKKSGRNYLQIADQQHLPSADSDPVKRTEDQEMMHKIRNLIAMLPEKQRNVITLRDIEGHSYKEIAGIMEIEMSHVKVLLHRARTFVKEQLLMIDNYGISHSR